MTSYYEKESEDGLSSTELMQLKRDKKRERRLRTFSVISGKTISGESSEKITAVFTDLHDMAI